MIIQLKFLQYYENVEVPQIPFSTGCSRFQLCYRSEYAQCKLCKSRRFHRAVLQWLLTSPLLCVDRCRNLSRQCRKSSRFRRRSSGQGCWHAVGVQKHSSSTRLAHVPVVVQRLVPMETVQLDGLEAWVAHYFDDELSLVFFFGPCTQVQGQGPCPQGRNPQNSVHPLACKDKLVHEVIRPHHHHHPPPPPPQPPSSDFLRVTFVW